MAADLTFGSIPQLYREVYDIISPTQEQIDHDTFIKVLSKSNLQKHVLTQIWETADGGTGHLTRNGLYKALALTALAQQGKQLTDNVLETYTDQELPKPSLGDLSDLNKLSRKVHREKHHNALLYRYEELCQLDTVKVELVPEKKGLILKHVEYEITSQKCRATVLRRYNDFVSLHEMLLLRYPYRMIPRLPPKKMMGADRYFIEDRRKSLRRFLNAVVRHPVIGQDKVIKYFLTFNGSDLQHKIKAAFSGVPDEFMTNELALKAKDLVPMDTQLQFSSAREHLRILTQTVTHLRDIADRMVTRSCNAASDMLLMGKELNALHNDTSLVSTWATGNCDTWMYLKKGLKKVSLEFTTLSDKEREKGLQEDDGIVEQLNIFLDILIAYRDLCDRQEKGVLTDHQRALQKMGQYKKKKMTATLHGPSEAGTVEQLEHRILAQENEISNMENRNYFSLYCVQMECQLVHANMVLLYKVLENMADVQSKSHSELGRVWQEMVPIIAEIFPPTTSPLGSPHNSPTQASISI
ncbi:sorting nexin-8-like [Tubulanus polymorphus]|uniref:sorting nexin-8-like n=1 Tax=Tubulanus polymorphus TaxID=672921 RepID=UPI003DA242BA